jgi:hypothetical protein
MCLGAGNIIFSYKLAYFGSEANKIPEIQQISFSATEPGPNSKHLWS